MELVHTIVTFFREGGFFMYPVLFVAALGTAVVIERLIYVARSAVNGEPLWQPIQKSLAAGRVDDAIKLCQGKQQPLPHVLLQGLKAVKAGEPREALQSTMEEAMLDVLPPLERRTPYLPILANVATLLGLLGTIIGVIKAFAAVSAADPSQKSVLLAQGISTALNMTAFGLIVAIPLILIYSYLQAQTTKIVDSIDQYSTKLANAASGHQAPVGTGRDKDHATAITKTSPAH
jgi:biopolymer transport protein ExbB/TolQ